MASRSALSELQKYFSKKRGKAGAPSGQRALLAKLDRAREELLANMNAAVTKARSRLRQKQAAPVNKGKAPVRGSGKWMGEVSYEAKLIAIKNGIEIPITKMIPVAIDPMDHKPTAAEIDDIIAADIEIQNISYGRGGVLKEVDTSKRILTLHKITDTRPLAKAPMKSAGAPLLNDYDTLPPDQNAIPMQCVPSYLRQIYGKFQAKLCRDNRTVALALLGYIGEKDAPGYEKPTLAYIKQSLADPLVEADVDELLREGVTTWQVKNFCKALGISMYACDEDNQYFEHYQPAEPSKKMPALVFRCQNNHMYPSADKASAMSAAATVKYIQTGSFHTPEAEQKEREYTVVEHPEPEHPNQLLVNVILSKNKTFPSTILMSDDGPYKLTYKQKGKPDEDHVFDSKRQVHNFIADRLGANPDRGMPANVKHVLEQHCPQLLQSTPNPNTDALLKTPNAKARSHQGLIDTTISQQKLGDMIRSGSATMVDMTRCYPSCLAEPADEFMIIGFTQEVRPWTLPQGAPLPLGIFEVTTDDYLLLHGNNIYSRRILEKARAEGIAFTINTYVEASQSMPKNTFHAAIAAIVQATAPYGLKMGVTPAELNSAAKLMLAAITGLLGKSEKKSYSNFRLNTDYDRVLEWVTDPNKMRGTRPIVRALRDHLQDDTVLKAFDQAFGNENAVVPLPRADWGPDYQGPEQEIAPFKDLYMYGFEDSKPLFEHNVPMYIQLTDHANIKLYDMIQAMGGQLVHRKVDCAITIGGRRDMPSPKNTLAETLPWTCEHPDMLQHCKGSVSTFGSYRVETQAPKALFDLQARDIPENIQTLPKPWTILPHNDSAQWQDIIKTLITTCTGLLIGAFGGFGKSYIIGKLIEHFGKDAVVLTAYTHTAANNIGGVTLSSLLGYNVVTGKFGRKDLGKLLAPLEIIVVDEWSMVPPRYVRQLCALKRMKPSIRFVLAGDERQLGSVDDPDANMFNLSATQFLTDNAKMKLTVSYRNDKVLLDALERSWVGQFDAKRELGNRPEQCRVNMAKDNTTVWAVNALWMNKEKPNDAMHIPEDFEDEEAQEAWIYPKLPLISKDTIKVKGEHIQTNCEFFTVTSTGEESFEATSDKSGSVVSCSYAEFHKRFSVGFCTTVHKRQCSTIKEPFAIYQWEKMAADKRFHWTALGRAETLDQIHYGKLEVTPPSREKAAIQKKLRQYAASDKAVGRPVCDITVSDVVKALDACGRICGLCGVDLKTQKWARGDPAQFTIDRVREKGQGHTKDNFEVHCLKCNVGHRNRVLL